MRSVEEQISLDELSSRNLPSLRFGQPSERAWVEDDLRIVSDLARSVCSGGATSCRHPRRLTVTVAFVAAGRPSRVWSVLVTCPVDRLYQ